MQAQSADGVIHDFPDGTDMSVIDRVMKSYATDAAGPQAAPTTMPASQMYGGVGATKADTEAPQPAQSSLGRIANAAVAGYQGGSFQTPETADKVAAENDKTLVGKYLTDPLVAASNVPFRAMGAIGGGLSQAATEVGTAIGGPELGRDLNMIGQVAPVAHVPGVSLGSTAAGLKQALTPGAIAEDVMSQSTLRGAIDAATQATSDAPINPQLRLLQQTEAGIMRRVGGEPGMLTDAENARLANLRSKMEGIQPPAPTPEQLPVTVPEQLPAVIENASVPAKLPTPETAPPRTSVEAKAIASAYYKRADEVGGTLLPEFTNKFIDKAESIAPQTAEGRAIAGDTTITGLVNRIQGLRDEPISLRGAQEIDERLGDLIDHEFGLRGLSKDGHNLLELQTAFRNMIRDAGPADTTSGAAGFEALKQGRTAWAQAMKMMDLERILNRANQTDNPVTSIRAGIRTLTSNPARVRGYSPEEIAALKDAASRGALGGALHVFGSRLAPLAVGAAGLTTGVIPGLLGAGLSHVAGTALRDFATRMQMRRGEDALAVLGSRVPRPVPSPNAP